MYHSKNRPALPVHAPRRTARKALSPAACWVPSDPAALARVLTRLRERLHAAAAGTLCACGPCAHQVRAAEVALGAPAGALRARLSPEPEAVVVASPPRAPLSAQVGSSAHLVVAGRRLPLAAGLTALAQGAHSGPESAAK